LGNTLALQACINDARPSTFALHRRVKKQLLIYALIYGLCGGLLIAALKLIEYRFIVLEHSIEIYGGLIALLFAAVGIWLGLKITRKEQVIVERETIVERQVMVPAGTPFALNQERLQELAITKRELEILGLIAHGMSNREIAEKLFVSENTVKTHSSRLFDKLSARRRTQAVQRAKELGLIP
jgi:two-component system, NarL family, response regulator LiaR